MFAIFASMEIGDDYNSNSASNLFAVNSVSRTYYSV